MTDEAWTWARANHDHNGGHALELYFQSVCANGSHKSKKVILDRARRTWAELPLAAKLPLLNRLWNLHRMHKDRVPSTTAANRESKCSTTSFPNSCVQLARLGRHRSCTDVTPAPSAVGPSSASRRGQKRRRSSPKPASAPASPVPVADEKDVNLDERLDRAAAQNKGFTYRCYFYDPAFSGSRISLSTFARTPIVHRGQPLSGWCPERTTVGGGPSPPAAGDPLAPVPAKQPIRRVRLEADNEERQGLMAFLSATCDMNQWHVLSVDRVDNPRLWSGFRNCIQNSLLTQDHRSLLPFVTRGQPGEVQWLFHGVHGPRAVNEVDQICTQGFNRTVSCDTQLGKGVYFTTVGDWALRRHSARLSPPGSDAYLFVCRVLTGLYTMGRPSCEVVPSLFPGSTESHDSTVDRLVCPQEFACFRDHQAYPMYLLRLQGRRLASST
jgi:poly [ADP-ribose] polymerase 10/14/15